MKLITNDKPKATPYDILKELFPGTSTKGVVGEPAELTLVVPEEK